MVFLKNWTRTGSKSLDWEVFERTWIPELEDREEQLVEFDKKCIGLDDRRRLEI